MDHHDHTHLDGNVSTEGNAETAYRVVSHNDHHIPSFFDDIDQGEEEKLLGMLHVPILHGGVREVLLLTSLSTDSALSFTFACIILVVCVTILELFRLLLWWVENRYSGGSFGMGSSCGCKQCNSLTACIGERREYATIHDAGSPSRGASPPNLEVPTPSNREGWLSWVCIGIIQFFMYLLSTFLMLIAMTMNIYLIISMAFGSMFGKMTVVLLKKKLMESHK